MKRILSIVLLISVFTIVSCSDESKMKSGIVEYLNKSAKDPKSYEFVELKIIDTITIGSHCKHGIESYNNLIKSYSEDMKSWELAKIQSEYYKKKWGSSFDKYIREENREISQCKENIKNCNDAIKLYKTKLNDNTVLCYRTLHRFRIKNGFGALDLVDKIVFFDKDFKFLSMVELKDSENIPNERTIFGDTKEIGKKVDRETMVDTSAVVLTTIDTTASDSITLLK